MFKTLHEATVICLFFLLETDLRTEFRRRCCIYLTRPLSIITGPANYLRTLLREYDVNSHKKLDSCIKLHISQRSCNQVCISLDVLNISCLVILRIFALGVIPVSRSVGILSYSPSSSSIVVGIPASRSRSVEFELGRALFNKFPNIYSSLDHRNSLAVF